MPPEAGAMDPVPVTAIAMKLLDVRLKPSSAIISSVMGEFSAPSRSEIAIIKAGGTIELHRIVQTKLDDDGEAPRIFIKLITRMETRSVLRCCSVVRLSGAKRDVLAVGADGGAISIIDFEGGLRGSVVHCMTFGKTGECDHVACAPTVVDFKFSVLYLMQLSSRPLSCSR
jgi:hypothetical protein